MSGSLRPNVQGLLVGGALAAEIDRPGCPFPLRRGTDIRPMGIRATGDMSVPQASADRTESYGTRRITEKRA